jgi:hypothetical protein
MYGLQSTTNMKQNQTQISDIQDFKKIMKSLCEQETMQDVQ